MKNEDKKTAVTLRLPAELKERLVKTADEIGISFNSLVLILINESLG